jgi:hypothetical protein
VYAGGGGALTLVEGSTFCVSASSGDVLPGRAQGLFVADTRVVSTWQLEVNGAPVEPLTTIEDESYRATFVARTVPRLGLADSTLLVQRSRYVGDGMREDLLLRNVGSEAAGVIVGYIVGADFADLFAVKEGRTGHLPDVEVAVGPDTLTYRCTVDGTTHSATVTATREPVVTPGAVTYRAVVPARGE